MCGEQSAALRPTLKFKGSSPRVRGAAKRRVAFVAALGIIPACAGSSKLVHDKSFRVRDHPRVCGEQCKVVN